MSLAIIIILGLFLIIFIICAFLKTLHIFFKVITLLSGVVFVLGLALIGGALFEGQLFKQDLENGPYVIFVDDSVPIGGVVLAPVSVKPNNYSILQLETARSLLNQKPSTLSYYFDKDAKRIIVVDSQLLLENKLLSSDYELKSNQLYVAFDDWLNSASNQLLYAYLNETVTFVPEPLSFRIIRTQPLIPINKFIHSTFFTTITP